MTQMNGVAVTTTSSSSTAAGATSPQCFSQTSSTGSELASPEGNESGGSVESVRDRSHLFLDPGTSRRPQGILGLKPRSNFAPNIFEPPASSAATVASAINNNNAIITSNSLNLNSAATAMAFATSPMLQTDFMQVVNALMSPANRRPTNFSLPLAQSAAFNNLQKSGLLVAETPTPTKIFYPNKAVSKEEKEFAEEFEKELQKVQAQNQFSATSLASPLSTNFLLPLISAALTPTNTTALPPLPPTSNNNTTTNNNNANNANSITASANAATLNALLTALTPILTPTHQAATTEQLFARAFASLAGTPTTPSTNFPGLPISQPQPPTTSGISNNNNSLSTSSISTGGTQAAASEPIPTTTSSSSTSSSQISDIYKNNLDSGLMDHMFNHDINNFSGLMSHFNQNIPSMPPHPQPLSTHNGYHQPGLQPGPPQQPGMMSIKTEPGINGYNNNNNSNGMGHSLQGASATGMCQPPPQNLSSCNPSTSSHQMSSYQSHLTNNLHELEVNEQEKRKLERKRARNRMAASKCRQRKIERIQQLEGEVQQERQRFQSLQSSINGMEKTISMLKHELQRHKHSGCTLEQSTQNLMNHLSTIMNNNVQIPMDTR